MKKVLYSALILTALAILIIPAMPNQLGEDGNSVVQGMDQLCFVKPDAGEEKLYVSISDFNSASKLTSYQSYGLIYAYYDTLNTVDSSKLIQLIDNGSVICVRGNMCALNLYEKLGLPFDGDETFVSGVTVSGMFLYNQSGNYYYGLICDTELAEGFGGEPYETQDVEQEPVPTLTTMSLEEGEAPYAPTEEEGTFEYLDEGDFYSVLTGFRLSCLEQGQNAEDGDTVYFQLPQKAFNGRPYYVYITGRRNGELMGSISITQYRYDICVYREGGVNKVITDIVSQVSVSSSSSVHLLDYKANMNANVSNMSVIGQSYLNSQSSTTYTLPGGIGVSGNISGSTSNTYSANNQNITNHFLKQKIKEWWCDPTKNWKGASWELEPAIRIRNNNASSWKNQAYTYVTAARWQKNLLVGYYIPNAIQVGGSW